MENTQIKTINNLITVTKKIEQFFKSIPYKAMYHAIRRFGISLLIAFIITNWICTEPFYFMKKEYTLMGLFPEFFSLFKEYTWWTHGNIESLLRALPAAILALICFPTAPAFEKTNQYLEKYGGSYSKLQADIFTILYYSSSVAAGLFGVWLNRVNRPDAYTNIFINILYGGCIAITLINLTSKASAYTVRRSFIKAILFTLLVTVLLLTFLSFISIRKILVCLLVIFVLSIVGRVFDGIEFTPVIFFK